MLCLFVFVLCVFYFFFFMFAFVLFFFFWNVKIWCNICFYFIFVVFLNWRKARNSNVANKMSVTTTLNNRPFLLCFWVWFTFFVCGEQNCRLDFVVGSLILWCLWFLCNMCFFFSCFSSNGTQKGVFRGKCLFFDLIVAFGNNAKSKNFY